MQEYLKNAYLLCGKGTILLGESLNLRHIFKWTFGQKRNQEENQFENIKKQGIYIYGKMFVQIQIILLRVRVSCFALQSIILSICKDVCKVCLEYACLLHIRVLVSSNFLHDHEYIYCNTTYNVNQSIICTKCIFY